METLIKNITTIQTGLFAKSSGEAEVIYLQSKHFDETGQLQVSLFPDLIRAGISDKHFLRHGDILFAAKGTKNFAAVFNYNEKPAVASTSFFVIRLIESTNKKILPEYVAWFLNLDDTLRFLKSKAIGTSPPSISKQVLGDLEILIPDLEKQKSILTIAQLWSKEKILRETIERLREKKIQQQIISTLK